MKNIHNDYINILKIFSFVVFIIVIYFLAYLIKFNNPSDIDLLSRECFSFIKDYWALSHIILFFIVTYIYPKRYIFIMLCGILWELIEHIFRYIIDRIHHKRVLYDYWHSKLDNHIKKRIKNKKNLNYDNWWYGRPEDILYNSIGIILALIARSILKY